MIHKAHRFRLYPTKEQRVKIEKTLGCVRYVYNYFLREWNEHYDTYGRGLNFAYCSSQLPKLKKEEETKWLKECDSTALQAAVKQLSDAFQYYYRHQIRFPKPKSKNDYYQRFVSKQVLNNIEIQKNYIKIPKIGWVKFKKSRSIEGAVTSITVTKEATGRYFVSVMTKFEQRDLQLKENIAAVLPMEDGSFLTSDGRVYRNEFLTQEWIDRLRREEQKQERLRKRALQEGRMLSRAKNYQKQRCKVARLYEELENSREDFLHKVTTDLVQRYDSICIPKYRFKESIPVIFTEKVSEVSWQSFVHKLSYKCHWYGCLFYLVPFEKKDCRDSPEISMQQMVRKAQHFIRKYQKSDKHAETL